MYFNPIITFINYLIFQNHFFHNALAKHYGKTIFIDSNIIQIYLLITPHGFIENTNIINTNIIPNVIIRIQLTDIPLILTNLKYIFSYIKIEGDIECINTILQLTKSLSLDIEYELSKIFGDIISHQMISGITFTISTIKTVYQKLLENLVEYFVEEQLMLVSSTVLIEFTNNIIKLRDDFERLLKRIEKLEHY